MSSSPRPSPRLRSVAFGSIACAALLACNALLDNADRELRPDDVFSEGGSGFDREVPSDSAPGPGADASTSCGADLMTSAQSCGACGHDCLGGMCSAGHCQPFVFATQSEPEQVFFAQGTVYFSDHDSGGGISWCPEDACPKPTRTFFDTGLYGLAVSASGIGAVSVSQGVVYTFPLRFGSGTSGSLLAAGQTPIAAAIDATNVYFTSTNGDVYRCARSGCSNRPTRIGLGAPNGAAIAVDPGSSYVYWGSTGIVAGSNCEGGCIQGLPISALDAGSVGVSCGRLPRTLAVVDSRLIWTGNGGAYAGEVSYRDNGVGGSEWFYGLSLGVPWGVTADPTNVYFTLEDAGGSIQRTGRLADAGQNTTIASGQKDPRGIAVSDKAIYWANLTGGAIMKLAK